MYHYVHTGTKKVYYFIHRAHVCCKIKDITKVSRYCLTKTFEDLELFKYSIFLRLSTQQISKGDSQNNFLQWTPDRLLPNRTDT